MAMRISRRAAVPTIALGAVGASACGRSAATSEADGDGAVASDITVEPLAERLTLFAGAGGHVVAHEGPDSVALIDGGAREHTTALLAAIAERFDGKPVAALVNTHWHPAQTGANDALGADGVAIVAHENTRRWMTTRIEQRWNGPVFEPRAEVALPTRTFYLHDALEHGGARIPLVYTPRAHTDGDIHAVFADADVIAASGVAYPRTYPVLDTATNGWIGEMLDATRALLERAGAETVIVPADGRLVTREDLAAQEEMLATVLGRFQSMARQGMGADDMLENGIAAEYVETFGDPTDFIYTAWDGLWDHMRGLNAF